MRNKSKLNTILLIIIIMLLAVGIWAILNQKKNSNVENYDFPKSADLISKDAPAVINQTTQQVTTTTTDPASSKAVPSNTWGVYSNAQYGFSFEYPGDWILLEDFSKNSVKITTKSTSIIGVDNVGNPVAYSPDYSITFTKTDKDFFNQPINTKTGQITYDPNHNIVLVDGECRPPQQIFGSMIKGFYYGGSNMSSPAYGDYAITTMNGKVVIVHAEQGIAMTDPLLNQLTAIFNSFKLLKGNNSLITTCAI